MERINKSTTLRIGIDMHTVDGIYQGTRTHVLELFSRVIPMCPKIDFYLFLHTPTALEEFSDNFTLSNVNIIKIPFANKLYRLLWFLPRMQKKYDLDYFHSQYIFPLPMFSHGLVTIHDILFETHPEFFSMFFRIRSKLLIRYTAKKAKHIFTVSAYTKNTIALLYNIPLDKITVINNAVNEKYIASDGAKIVLAKLGLIKNKYILNVGRNDPRKNIQILLKSYALLSNSTPPLIIVSSSNNKNIIHLINKYNLTERVKILSNIPDNELPILYKSALLFIYPSYAEGFGMPILEAMASGTCVIASKTTAMFEIAKDSAFLINPDNPKELEEAMKKAIVDDKLRQKYEHLGLARAAEFSWENSAIKLAKIIKSIT